MLITLKNIPYNLKITCSCSHYHEIPLVQVIHSTKLPNGIKEIQCGIHLKDLFKYCEYKYTP